ncbi:type II toxin-antitoxin system Phd/YefM family antitoxin [Nibricoccus sp. IMCC34717]|uniref:type II toxin-antitoxin system Phd/YefM family antitoxin n=1 Tax=Nibricoccus sp. IMCC34717 TaxID=3034021 RepID=UPI00384F2288
MKTATVRQIRNAFPEVLRHIRNGEPVSITSRRKVVATLVPPLVEKARKGRKPWANGPERRAELEAEPILSVSGAVIIATDRERF